MGTAGLQNHCLCTGLVACTKGLFSGLGLCNFACISDQVVKYFRTHQILIKCCGFLICAILTNTSNKRFEMVYEGKTYHTQFQAV